MLGHAYALHALRKESFLFPPDASAAHDVIFPSSQGNKALDLEIAAAVIAVITLSCCLAATLAPLRTFSHAPTSAAGAVSGLFLFISIILWARAAAFLIRHTFLTRVPFPVYPQVADFAYIREQQNCCNGAYSRCYCELPPYRVHAIPLTAGVFIINPSTRNTEVTMGRRHLSAVCATDMPFGIGTAAAVLAFLGIVIQLPYLLRRASTPVADVRMVDPEMAGVAVPPVMVK